MDNLSILFVLFLNPVNLFWLLFSISACITLIHTIDEVIGDGGPIWVYLWNIPKELYFIFQTANVVLAWIGYSGSDAAIVALILIRLVDLTFTHGILRIFKPVNPGFNTSLALLLDVLFLLLFYSGALT